MPAMLRVHVVIPAHYHTCMRARYTLPTGEQKIMNIVDRPTVSADVAQP